jgi:hypothetical protein
MKRFLFLFSIFLSFSFVFSQTYYLNVNLKDGTKATYEIADIIKIDFSEITNVEDLDKLSHIVKSFKLMQNYPNPFNPSTTIQYEIPKKGKVEIQIFDITGRFVKNIVSQNQPSGTHKTVWNGNNESGQEVASGFYVYTVKFENTLLSKKMILLK